jgi:hypothetical protein
VSRGSVSIGDLPPEAQDKVRRQLNGVALGPGSPLRGARAKPRELELIEQRAVIRWADDPEQRAKWPELAYLFHVPNGGHRSKAVAGKMKSTGVRRGVPDLWLPASRWLPTAEQFTPGCVVELKASGTGRLTGLQRDWLAYLQRDGWIIGEAYGAAEAIAMLTGYLCLPRSAV